MGDQRAGRERRLKEMIGALRCQVCRHGFDRDQVRIAARHEQLWKMSVRCGHCRHQQVFWVALLPEDEAEWSDVSPAEEARFAALEPVCGDHILDIHEFLDEFDGDFKQLFARSTPPS